MRKNSLLDTKVAGNSGGSCLCGIASGCLKTLFCFGVFDHGLLRLITRCSRHDIGCVRHLLEKRSKPSSVQNPVPCRLFWVTRARILGQVTNFTLAVNLATSWLTISSQNLCEGGFTRAVATNEPNLVPCCDPKGDFTH